MSLIALKANSSGVVESGAAAAGFDARVSSPQPPGAGAGADAGGSARELGADEASELAGETGESGASPGGGAEVAGIER